jgi:hypothetical protein
MQGTINTKEAIKNCSVCAKRYINHLNTLQLPHQTVGMSATRTVHVVGAYVDVYLMMERLIRHSAAIRDMIFTRRYFRNQCLEEYGKWTASTLCNFLLKMHMSVTGDMDRSPAAPKPTSGELSMSYDLFDSEIFGELTRVLKRIHGLTLIKIPMCHEDCDLHTQSKTEKIIIGKIIAEFNLIESCGVAVSPASNGTLLYTDTRAVKRRTVKRVTRALRELAVDENVSKWIVFDKCKCGSLWRERQGEGSSNRENWRRPLEEDDTPQKNL